MLERLHDLQSQKRDFAFESTLASRTLVPFLKEWKQQRYTITMIYVGIEGLELAKERIRERVKQGGHSIPDIVVERRFGRSVENFWNLYSPLADELRVYDNTYESPLLVAHKEQGGKLFVDLPERMGRIMNREIRESKTEYTANKIDRAVKAAVEEELDRKRKLGLPIVFGKDGKVIVMVGDKVVKEIPYNEHATIDAVRK